MIPKFFEKVEKGNGAVKIKRAIYNLEVKDIFNIVEKDNNFLYYDGDRPFTGKLELIYESGKLEKEGMIENGLQEGEWREYYENGELKSFQNMKNGKREGTYFEYYENGNQMLEIDYKQDKMDGLFKRYHENGHIEIEGKMVNSLKEGKFLGYYKNGVIEQEVNFINNLEQGETKEYYKNSQLRVKSNYRNGKMNGFTEYYYSNGIKQLEGTYFDGKREDEWREYYEDIGELKKIFHYKNNKISGKTKGYYRMSDEVDGLYGKKIKVENHNQLPLKYETGEIGYDEFDGDYKSYYPDGKEMEVGKYKNGKKEGLWKYFYPTVSKVKKEIIFENDEEMELKGYDLKGKIIERMYWVENRKYSEKYYPNGQLFEKIVYIKNLREDYGRIGEIVRFGENGKTIYEKKTRKRFFENNDPDFGFDFIRDYFSKIIPYLKLIKRNESVDKLKLVKLLNEVDEASEDDVFEKIKRYLKENKIEMMKFSDGSLRTNEHVLEFFEENLNKYVEIERKKNNIEKKEEMILDKISDNDRKILIQPKETKITQEQIAKKEADKKFDETRNWLGSRTERTLYKGSVFPVRRFIERIKDFDTDLKERVYRFIDSYTKDWISTITFDTGETYELEEALKKFRKIMGLSKEEK